VRALIPTLFLIGSALCGTEEPMPLPTTKPVAGEILGGGATFQPSRQLMEDEGAKVMSADGRSFKVAFSGTGNGSILVKPTEGMWNLSEQLEVRVLVGNVGDTPVTPVVQLQSRGGPSDSIRAVKALAPGASTEIVVPFTALVPWRGLDDPRMKQHNTPRINFAEGQPGTGTKFTSNTATGIAIGAYSKAVLEITSIRADVPPHNPLPEWLGKRPPVDGEWALTFDETFEGGSLDLQKWNIYSGSEWHIGNVGFSKDNAIVRDGKLRLRLEKRRVHHNDNPAYPEYDYATATVDTFGKWTQRYGYFEARLKLPTAPVCYPAFWLFPDRGIDTPPSQWGKTNARMETGLGGMELDMLEHLTTWGPYRSSIGMHWDNYFKHHKTTGFFNCYFQPDKEGYLTMGILWTPESVVFYQQGRECARWESPRVGAVQASLNIQNITGGKETLHGEGASNHALLLQNATGEDMDDEKLPDDLTVDYVRVWQRKDLATPEDGPKPNEGGPLAPGVTMEVKPAKTGQ